MTDSEDEGVFKKGDGMFCRYGLILTDLSMPGMDGFQFVEEARNVLKEAEIPKHDTPTIAAVTGHVESEYIVHALENGIDYIYPKPVDS